MTKGRILINGIIVLALLLTSSPAATVASPVGKSWQLENISSEMMATGISDDWDWPMPEKPIPYHKPGRKINADLYTTQVSQIGNNGLLETVTHSGVEAMVADGLDPLAGNYRLVEWDQVLRSSEISAGIFGLESFSISTEEGQEGMAAEPGSQYLVGNRSMDIAAGDLNNDGQAEQIAAWMDASNQIHLAIGEMPGSFGKTTSAPAAVANDNSGRIELLVRGYDQVLWHCSYDPATKECDWENEGGGGVMLSAPAVVAQAAGQFEVYAILMDNLVYRRAWDGSWSPSWVLVDDAAYWQPLDRLIPIPELDPPAVVRRGAKVDMFRLGPDNTLRWRHYNGASWGNWQNLGGMLASSPAAVALTMESLQVFARGADEALWTRVYNNGWGAWKRVKLTGMAEEVTIASTPAALSLPAGKIDVYVRGSDDNLWQVHYNGSAWGTWSGGGNGEGALASAPGAALLAGDTYLFAQTQQGGLQVKSSGLWEEFPEGLPPCCNLTSTGLTGIRREQGIFKDFSLNIESGRFWGDGRSQIALGYLTNARKLNIVLYDISTNKEDKGFTPVKLNQGDFFIETVGDILAFRFTTGNFLRGEIDDIALVYFVDTTYYVKVLRFNRETRQLEIVKETEQQKPPPAQHFNGTLEIVSGDIDGDGYADFAINASWFYNGGDWHWDQYYFMTRVFSVDNKGNLNKYYREDYGQVGVLKREVNRFSISVALAAGDVNGNGRDEIIRTWPTGFSDKNDTFMRRGQVISWKSWANEGAGFNVTNLEDGERGPTRNSYGDRLLVADFDRDLVGEIFWQVGAGGTTRTMRHDVYKFDHNDGKYKRIIEQSDEFHDYSRLAAADFSGRSLRVGLPTYRRQYNVGQVIAVVNAPPKHRDIIDGVVYNLNSDQESTYSRFEQVKDQSTEVSVTTKKDWGVDSSFRLTIGDPEGTHTRRSLESSYGQNFEYTGGSTQTLTYQQSIKASTDDILYYTRLNYDVWEYPVYDRLSNTPQGYLSVVWPDGGMESAVESANTCEGWYSPNHQLMNVWSYPSKEEHLLDRDPDGSSDLLSLTNYEIGTSQIDFSVDFSQEQITRRSHEFSLGFAASYEKQIGGDKIGFSLKVISFETRLPSLYFSGAVHYNHSELSTWTTVTSESTILSGYFDIIPEGQNYRYFVKPYLYWSDNDYLVLNYLTDPSNAVFWSVTGQNYIKPDPAFILPWADGRCNHVWSDARYFSSDINIDPPMASAGDEVKISATLRNFSKVANTSPPHNKSFKVAFYQGDPDKGGVKIGEQTVAAGELGPRAVVTKSIDWIAQGSGRQHIYAVIDPEGALTEVHTTNNKGYGLLMLDVTEFIDVGQPKVKPYHEVSLTMGEAGLISNLYVPLPSFTENMRIDMRTAPEYHASRILGSPFEIKAFQTDWDTPEVGFSLRPKMGDPPGLITIDYSDADRSGFNVNNLTLYRLNVGKWDWEAANLTCGIGGDNTPLYQLHRFPEENLIAMPVCEVGVFALSDSKPQPPKSLNVLFLPVTMR